MRYKNILLDLDGTIIDPQEGITKSVAYALEAFGIKVDNLQDLCKFIGPPLKDSFRDFYNFSDTQMEMAVQKYRERFATIGVYENFLYEGIKNFIYKANDNGLNLFVATSKPTVFARQIIAHYNLETQFVFVGGSELDDSRKTKADVIRYVLQTNAISSLSETIMIGDRKHDVIGAKETNIDAVGVLYGYGDYEELTEAGADYIAEKIDDLFEILEINQ